MTERSALEHHPELAQLWTLHFSARMALRTLECRRYVGPPLLVRPAVTELQESIQRLIVAVERYRNAVLIEPAEDLRVHIPESWSAEQADALLGVMSGISDQVARWQQRAEIAKRRRSG